MLIFLLFWVLKFLFLQLTLKDVVSQHPTAYDILYLWTLRNMMNRRAFKEEHKVTEELICMNTETCTTEKKR